MAREASFLTFFGCTSRARSSQPFGQEGTWPRHPDRWSRHSPNRSQRLEAVRVGRLPARNFLEANMKILEANMKTILLAALVLGFCGLADAQGEKADPIGTWNCEYEIGGQKRMSTLTIKVEGDKLAGTMNWPDQKDEKLKDVKFKDGKLTFSAVRKFMDNTIPIDYTLTIDGDNLKGKGAAEVGGQKQEFDIEGKREKKDK